MKIPLKSMDPKDGPDYGIPHEVPLESEGKHTKYFVYCILPKLKIYTHFY